MGNVPIFIHTDKITEKYTVLNRVWQNGDTSQNVHDINWDFVANILILREKFELEVKQNFALVSMDKMKIYLSDLSLAIKRNQELHTQYYIYMGFKELKKIRTSPDLNRSLIHHQCETIMVHSNTLMEFINKYCDSSEPEHQPIFENSAPNIKLTWNGQKNALTDLFYKLKRISKDGENYLISNSNEDIALFLKDNFDVFADTKISTIIGELKKSKRPQRTEKLLNIS